MPRSRAFRLLALVVLVGACVLGRPSPTLACTGEVVPLDEVIGTADAIVIARIVETGPEVAIDVPGSWTFGVERILAGGSPSRFTLTWPAAVSVCDGFSGVVGDRVVIAVGATGFFRPMHPYWLLGTTREPGFHVGARTDLDQLAARLGQPIPALGADAPAAEERAAMWPVALVAIALAGVVLVAALALAAWVGDRRRGGL